MSKKYYLPPEVVEYRNQRKLQNQIVLKLCIVMLVPPLLLFPAYPRNNWQYSIYRFITENIYISIGTKGPLPFFTVLTSIYSTLIMFIFCSYLCWSFIKKYGFDKKYQEKIYHFLFANEFMTSRKYPRLEKPIIKKVYILSLFLLSLLIGIFHFTRQEISFPSGNRRGALIELGYNYKVGVIFWETFASIMTAAPIFYFLLIAVYLINYYFRGLGSGKITPPLKNKKRKSKK